MFRALKGACVCETSKVEVQNFFVPVIDALRSVDLLAQQRESKLGSQKTNFGGKKWPSIKQMCGGPESLSKGSSTGDSRQQTADIAFARVQ